MAVYPGMVKQRGVRSTTVVVQANAATGTKGSVSSKAISSSAPTRVTPADVSDPSRLGKVINDRLAKSYGVSIIIKKKKKQNA